MDHRLSDDEALLDPGEGHVTDNERPLARDPLAGRSMFRRWVTVEPALCVYFMACIPTLPLTEQYVLQQVGEKKNYTESSGSSSNCKENTSSPIYQLQQEVMSEASHWMIVFTAAALLPGFISTVLLGSYSDKAGRKVPLVASLIGSILHSISIVIIINYKLPLETLLVPMLLEGSLGGVSSFIMAAFAYIADISDHESRSVRIFILEVAVGIGVIISTISVGIMIRTIGFMYPFVAIGGLHLINLVYIMAYVIETRKKDPTAKLFTFNHYIKAFRLIGCDDGTGRRWKMMLCMGILWLTCTADLGGGDVLAYTQLNSPICFNSVLVGYWEAADYICRNVGSLFCLKLLYGRLGDCGLMVLGCISGILYYLLLAFTTTKTMMFLVPLGALCYMLLIPMVRAFSSKLFNNDEQGTFFSSISLIQTFSVVFGDIIFNSIYSATLLIFKGMVFLVEAGVIFISLTVVIILTIGVRREKGMKVMVERNV